MINIIIAIMFAVLIYTIIGCIPGTDETSVLYPISFALIISGVDKYTLIAFFLASIVTLNIMNLMPSMLLSLPGGVLSMPMIDSANFIKQKNESNKAIRYMGKSAIIGANISVIVGLILCKLLSGFSQDIVNRYIGYFFIFGAIFLSLISKNKLVSLLSILPISFLFMAFRHFYWAISIVPEGKNITSSFFLAITMGPLCVSLFELTNKDIREQNAVSEKSKIVIKEEKIDHSLPKNIVKSVSLASFISSFLFFLSPVSLLILSKDFFGRGNNEKDAHLEKLSVMSAMAQSTYISGITISLFGLFVAVSPAALGPAGAFFVDGKSIFEGIEFNKIVFLSIITVFVTSIITYLLLSRFVFKIIKFVSIYISHESVLALFVSIVALLSYMEGGIINTICVFLIGFVCGNLTKIGVNLGVIFMSLYASPYLLKFFM